MAFKAVGTLDSHGGPILRSDIIANSLAMVVGYSVMVTSGFIAFETTGSLVYGHVNSLVTNLGTPLLTTGVAGSAIGSFVDTYTTASNNQTVGFVRAMSDISKRTMYSATYDAAIGTTTGSNLLGYHINVTDKTQISESSAATTTAQYFIWGVDPADSTKGIVTIYQSQVFGV